MKFISILTATCLAFSVVEAMDAPENQARASHARIVPPDEGYYAYLNSRNQPIYPLDATQRSQTFAEQQAYEQINRQQAIDRSVINRLANKARGIITSRSTIGDNVSDHDNNGDHATRVETGLDDTNRRVASFEYRTNSVDQASSPSQTAEEARREDIFRRLIRKAERIRNV